MARPPRITITASYQEANIFNFPQFTPHIGFSCCLRSGVLIPLKWVKSKEQIMVTPKPCFGLCRKKIYCFWVIKLLTKGSNLGKFRC